MPEQRLESGRGDAARSNDLDAVSVRTASARERWMVTGTTRNSGQASIMATSTPPASSARYSVCPGCRKPGVLESLLLDGIGHQPGDLAGKRQSGPTLDGLQGGRRIDWIRMAGAHGAAQLHRKDGQRRIEDGAGVSRPRDLAHRDIETELVGEGRQADGVVEDEEGPRTALAASTRL